MISESAFRVISTSLMLVSAASFFACAIFLFRVNANRKEGVPGAESFEGVLNPDKLTERGLVARRYCYYGFAVGILSAVILVILSKFVR
jgi:hypothetical protein